MTATNGQAGTTACNQEADTMTGGYKGFLCVPVSYGGMEVSLQPRMKSLHRL